MDNYFLYSLECVKIRKQLFASGSVIFAEYSPRLRLGEYSPIITSLNIAYQIMQFNRIDTLSPIISE